MAGSALRPPSGVAECVRRLRRLKRRSARKSMLDDVLRGSICHATSTLGGFRLSFFFFPLLQHEQSRGRDFVADPQDESLRERALRGFTY